jgi:flavoprotein
MQAKNVNAALDHLSKFTIAASTANTASATASSVSVSATASAVTSANRDDVALYVLGIGKTAQTQLTLNK